MNRKAASILGIALIVTALLPSAWLAWRFRSMPQMGAYHDDAMYLQSAKSVAEGHGYRIPSLPDTPYQTKYPPVFPFLMSLIWRMDPQFPGNLSKLTALCWSMLPLYVFLLYRVLNRWGLAPLESAAICMLTALSPHFVLAGMMTMSELTFGVLSLIAIWYLERGTAESNRGLLMLAGAAGGLAFLTRTQGIALLIGALTFFAWKKQWRNAAAYGAVFGTAVAAWFVWTRAHSYQGSDPVTIYYVDYVRFYAASVQWSELPRLVWINVDSILVSAAGLIFADIPVETSWRMFAWVVAAASISGIRRLVKQSGQYHMAFFALAAFLLLIPWNWPPNERFLLPVWPAVAAGFYTEMSHLVRMCRANLKRPEFSQRAVAAGILVASLAACGLIPYRNYDRTVRNLPLVLQYYQNMIDARIPAYDWIRKNVPAGSQILTYDDPLLYLYTGRRGLAMPIVPWVTSDGTQKRLEAYFATAPEFMREHNLDFVLMADGDFHRDLENAGRNALQSALSHAGWFEPVLQSPGAQVYRLKPDAGLESGASAARAPAGTWWASIRQSAPTIR